MSGSSALTKDTLHRTPGLPRGSVVKNPPADAGDAADAGLFPELEDSLEEEMAPHSSILAWKSQGRRSLVGYSPWDCRGTQDRNRAS